MQQGREERGGGGRELHRMDSGQGQLATPGSRTSSVLPDLLPQVNISKCNHAKISVLNSTGTCFELLRI